MRNTVVDIAKKMDVLSAEEAEKFSSSKQFVEGNLIEAASVVFRTAIQIFRINTEGRSWATNGVYCFKKAMQRGMKDLLFFIPAHQHQLEGKGNMRPC